MESCAKLWGGRFNSKTDSLMEKFNASINFDKVMFEEDIKGSQAYAKGLQKIHVITADECVQICDGLEKVAEEWRHGSFLLKLTDEDIHTANERRLTELIGPVAGKLHTGRSRNDQAVTDTRLWLFKEVGVINDLLFQLIKLLVQRAADEIDIKMPGYTHMQRAQPIRWSQWLLSYGWAFKEDFDRLREIGCRINMLPLGSGAIAGNPFGIDREFLAEQLRCHGVIENSIYATSSRDFVVEFMFWASLFMNHLSRLAEDLILYNTKEFQFISLDDAYSTGSSLMPQKKNPDSLELIRGKSGRIFGNFSGFMMTMKGLPSSYNKDLQEDKEPLLDTVGTIKDVIKISVGTLQTLTVNGERCFNALSPDMLATDVAYYLVHKGVPFREAHNLAGQVVQLSETKGLKLNELTHSDLLTISDLFEEDVKKIWDYSMSVDQYTSIGGTSKSAVSKQIESFNHWMAKIQKKTFKPLPQDIPPA